MLPIRMTTTIASADVHPLGTSGTASTRPWLCNYPPGVPSTIELGRHQTLTAAFASNVEKYGQQPAIECLGTTVTYRQIDRQSQSLAAWLQSLRLQEGARVAVMLPSTPLYAVCLMAILKAGLVVVNVNPLYTPREVAHQLNDSGAEIIILLEQFAHTLQRVRDEVPVKHVVVTSIGDMSGSRLKGALANFVIRHIRKAVPAWSLPGHHRYAAVIRRGATMDLRKVSQNQDSLAMLQYTGGTTGVAKGTMLSHRNLLAASAMAGVWLRAALCEAPAVTAPKLLLPLPLYHIFTIYVLMIGFDAGACCVLVPNPRDIRGLVKTMQRSRFHLMFGLNTLYNGLLNASGIERVDFSGCKAFVAGGTATQRAVAERWKALTGRWILEGWGMSETTGAGTCNPHHRNEFNGSIGLPLPSTEISIRDEQGNVLPVGQPGEIHIAGPQVMAGYWNRQDETERVLGADGFLKTGDIGVIDEHGYVRIVDRKKDMVLVSGFNVYPSEIEEVVVSLPGVLEAAAIGVSDEHSGEAVKLFVVKKDPELSAQMVREHCARNLTNYKRPRQIVFIDALPKSPVGKVLRRELPRN